jgi:hypothetical protein
MEKQHKSFIFLIILFSIAAFVVYNRISNESNKTVIASNINNQQAAEQLFRNYLRSNKTLLPLSRKGIRDYRIHSVDISEDNGKLASFFVEYSVRTASRNSDWIAGNGEDAPGNWIRNKCSFVYVDYNDGKYSIGSMGTGP